MNSSILRIKPFHSQCHDFFSCANLEFFEWNVADILFFKPYVTELILFLHIFLVCFCCFKSSCAGSIDSFFCDKNSSEKVMFFTECFHLCDKCSGILEFCVFVKEDDFEWLCGVHYFLKWLLFFIVLVLISSYLHCLKAPATLVAEMKTF